MKDERFDEGCPLNGAWRVPNRWQWRVAEARAQKLAWRRRDVGCDGRNSFGPRRVDREQICFKDEGGWALEVVLMSE